MELQIKRQEILLRKQELEEIRLGSERKDQLRREEMNQMVELMKIESERRELECRTENERKERERQIEREEDKKRWEEMVSKKAEMRSLDALFILLRKCTAMNHYQANAFSSMKSVI